MPNEKLLKLSIAVVLVLGLMILSSGCGDYKQNLQECRERCSPHDFTYMRGTGEKGTLQCTCDLRTEIR